MEKMATMFESRSTNEESNEFNSAVRSVVHLLQQLRGVENGLRAWATVSHKVSATAFQLARAVETEPNLFISQSVDIRAQLADTSILRAVQQKIKTLDALLQDRRSLVTLRLLKNRLERRVRTQVFIGPMGEVKKKQLEQRVAAATTRYEDAYTKLYASIKFVISEVNSKGHCSVIAPELAAFKAKQFKFFLSCQEIIQGSAKEDAKPLEEEWGTFSAKMAKKQSSALARLSARRASKLSKPLGNLDEELEKEEQQEKEEAEKSKVRRSAAAKHSSLNSSRSSSERSLSPHSSPSSSPRSSAKRKNATSFDESKEDEEDGPAAPVAPAAADRKKLQPSKSVGAIGIGDMGGHAEALRQKLAERRAVLENN